MLSLFLEIVILWAETRCGQLVAYSKLTILKIENDISLKVLNSHKMEADSPASGNPEDHDDSDIIDTAPDQENENEQVEEIEDEDNKGVQFHSIIVKVL